MLAATKICTSCNKLRNIKLHFHPTGSTCKQCLSDKYQRQVEQQKQAELEQTITQHYRLYA